MNCSRWSSFTRPWAEDGSHEEAPAARAIGTPCRMPQGRSHSRQGGIEMASLPEIYLAQRLMGVVFARVLTSPLSRALRTCELAGFGGQAAIDADLQEWD